MLRFVTDALKIVPYQFIDIGNVAEGTVAACAGNPLMSVPVLVDGDQWVIDSDQIAQYIVKKFDPTDRYKTLLSELTDINTRSVLNGLMTEEVKFILGKRTGVPVEQYPFFKKALEKIQNGLSWLETKADDFDRQNPGFKEFHLACAFEHLAYYDLFPLEYPRLKNVVDGVLKNKTIAATSPFILRPK